MKRAHKRWIAAVSGALAVMVGAIYANQAFAYSAFTGFSSNGYIVKEFGSYALLGGDQLKVKSSTAFPSLDGQFMNGAMENANVYTPSGSLDGMGAWPILQTDINEILQGTCFAKMVVAKFSGQN